MLWGGRVGVTVNRMPHVGRLHANVYFAHGYSGHGVAMASLAGTVLAEAIDAQYQTLIFSQKLKYRLFQEGHYCDGLDFILACFITLSEIGCEKKFDNHLDILFSIIFTLC